MHFSVRLLVFAALLTSCQPPELGGVCPPRGCDESGDAIGGGDTDTGCTLSSQCDGLCLGGVCAPGCDETAECGGEGVCAVAQADDEQVATVCRSRAGRTGFVGDPCGTDGECRGGVCVAGLCSRLCLTDCGDDAVCEPASLDRFGQSLAVAICQASHARASLELGDVTLGAAASEEISFVIPAGLASFTVVLLDWDGTDDQRIGFESLITPAGTTVVDLSDGTPELNPPTAPYPGAASVQVPSSDLPGVGPHAGTWRMRVGVYETTDYVTFTPVAGSIDEMRVVFERAGEEGGVFDLNLFFAPATGITADAAPASAYVQSMVNTLDAFYREQLGVAVGRVAFGELAVDHDTVELAPEARTVCATYSEPGPHRAAINVFLVNDLGFTGGFAGGIPGPPGVFGATGSGIVAEMLGSGANTGILLAHEIGHFLALQHTTKLVYDEANSVYNLVGYDSITDTPECSASAIQDCPDYQNAMFPFFPLSGLSFTAVQRSIVRANPMLYERSLEAGCPGDVPALDITGHGFADAVTVADSGDGSCGGTAAPERWHRYRLDTADLTSLELEVTGRGFAPVVYVREGECGAGSEVACDFADADTPLVMSLPTPSTGHLFIAVDGRDGTGGEYRLELVEVP